MKKTNNAQIYPPTAETVVPSYKDEWVDPCKPVVLVEVIFTNNRKVTVHRMEASAKSMSKSKTTIGEIFRRLHLAKP